MNPTLPTDQAAANLLQAARISLAASGGRVATFSCAAERYVAKGPGDGRSLMQAIFLKVFCRMAFGRTIPMASLRLSNGRRRLAYEAARLRALAEAGEAVPRVVALAGDCMVLQHVGTTLEQSLGSLSQTGFAAALDAAVDDLARFHCVGHWHGGSQVKNLTLRAGQLYRIDFEEDIGAHLPIDILQAYDLTLLVNSATLLGAMDEKMSTEQATRMLTRHLDRHPASNAAHAIFARAQPWLVLVCALLAPLRRRRGRSLKRIYILRDALNQALDRPTTIYDDRTRAMSLRRLK